MGHDTHQLLRERLNRALDVMMRGESGFSLSPPLLDDATDEGSLREWILRHHARYGLDPLWILTGIGPAPEGTAAPSRASVPVYAMSAIDPRSGLWRPEVVERIPFGPELIGRDQFVIRMEDRSMEPRIHCGAYLIVDPNQARLPEKTAADPSALPDGRIFALALPGEGLVVRMAHVETAMERVVLTALAESTPTIAIARAAAVRLVKGRVVRLAQSL